MWLNWFNIYILFQKKSDLKIGILTYFTRKNRISFEKLTENKYKLAIYKSDISYEKNNHNIEEDTKKFVSEKPFSEAKIPNFVTDITTKEIIQESMQYPFFPFDNKNKWVFFAYCLIIIFFAYFIYYIIIHNKYYSIVIIILLIIFTRNILFVLYLKK